MPRHEGYERCYMVCFDPSWFGQGDEPKSKYASCWNQVWYTVWSNEEERNVFEHMFHDVSDVSLSRLFWVLKACPHKTFMPTSWTCRTDRRISVTEKQCRDWSIYIRGRS